jgi:hypothetical protein
MVLTAADHARSQERLVAGAVVFFALWTLACHLTIACRGGLRFVLICFALLAATAAASVRWWRRQAGRDSPTGPAESFLDAGPAPTPNWILFCSLFLAAAVILLAEFTGRVEAISYGGIAVLAAAAWITRRDAPPPEPRSSTQTPAQSDPHASAVWIVASAVAILTLLIGRPDMDDCFHAKMAADIADGPLRPLTSRLDIVYGAPEFFWMVPVWRLQTLDALAGLVSLITRIPAMAVQHFILAPLAAFVGVLCLAALIRRLLPRHTLWVLLGSLFYLFADGEMNSSFANFSFSRFQQGKAILLAACLPAIMAYGMDAALAPSLPRFALLGLAQVAGLGLSSTGIWAAPAAAALSMLAAVPLRRHALGTLAAGAGVSLYPLLAGLAYQDRTMRVLAQVTEMAWDPALILPSAFLNALGHGPFALVSVFFLLTAWLFLPAGFARAFCVRLPLLFFLLFFNPLVAPWMAKYAVGARLYFRAFWEPQIPILAAIALAAPLFAAADRARRLLPWAAGLMAWGFAAFACSPPLFRVLPWRASQPWFATTLLWNGALLAVFLLLYALGVRHATEADRRRVRAAFLLTAAFCLLMPLRPLLSPDNALYDTPLTFGAPRLKVNPVAHSVARTLVAAVPERAAVLAPLSVSVLIPSLPHHPLPLTPPLDHLSFLAAHIGPEDAWFRWQLTALAGGENDGPYVQSIRRDGFDYLRPLLPPGFRDERPPVELLRTALDRYPLRAVCMSRPPDRAALVAILRQRGFQGWVLADQPGFEIWTLPADAPASSAGPAAH